jgi:astacin
MKYARILPALALAGLVTACQDAPLAPEPQGAPTGKTIPAPPSTDLRTGWIYGPGGEPMEVTFTVFEGWAIFEGDINLGRADQIAKTRDELVRSGGPRYGVFINGSSYRWPSGTVPYVIDASFDYYQRQTIIDAMSHVANTAAGVTFKQRTNETAYVVFAKHSSVCNSPVGRQGSSQTINLTDGCAYSMGTVAHEVLHTMGMWHEQSRCDRDSYITINLNNVLSTNHHNFAKKCSGNTTVFAYNEGSIMHYGTHDFSYNGGQVITSKRGLDYLMGQLSGLAQSDASTLNYIYKPYTPWVHTVTPDANGNAVATWDARPGATHYTFSRIERYEYYDNWAGTSSTQEYRYGPVTVYTNSITDGTYSGNSTCVTFDNMYTTEQWVYEWEIQAHFPDGITSYVGRSPAPIGPC